MVQRSELVGRELLEALHFWNQSRQQQGFDQAHVVGKCTTARGIDWQLKQLIQLQVVLFLQQRNQLALEQMASIVEMHTHHF
ncbi:hypothetical protein D9M71_830000 [compost metagenome]